jgi:PAS domain S-box-containing protein
MAGAGQGDALARWLSGDGLAALDHVTGEAVDVIGVMDRELTVRYLNHTAVPGLTRDGVIGRSVLDLVPPGYQDTAREVYSEVLRTGVGTRFETMYRGEQGMLIFEVRVGPVRLDDQVIGLVAITSNVTEQRRDGADRDRFFSLSLDMLIVATPEGLLRRVNPAFSATLGYGHAELIGTPVMLLVHPDDQPSTREASAQLQRGHTVIDFENRYRRRDGEYRVFSWRATIDPVTLDVYAVARDITDQREVETQLLHAQKMDAIGQLAGGIAHDFNNLMQAVLAHAELGMTRVSPSSRVTENLREIEGAGRRAADLTKQLLAFSRRQPTHPVPIDLNARVQGLIKLLRRLLPENIAIELKPSEKLDTVSADPTQLEQVIVNLCVNARDAMESGGTLTIETENVAVADHNRELQPWAQPGRFVLLKVTDTGIGMTAEVREHIFEPFFTTKGAHRGTGLGLSTVYGIVHQHGGFVRVHSAPGEGATFEVYFPADSRPAIKSEVPVSGDDAPGHETILIAEDEELVRKPVVLLLEAAGYRVLAARNGADALRLLRELDEPVHLALLDMVMPELDGPETWVQMQQLRPHMCVLFASGYAEGRHLERLPPDAEVVQKPFRASELLTRVRRKLDERASS